MNRRLVIIFGAVFIIVAIALFIAFKDKGISKRNIGGSTVSALVNKAKAYQEKGELKEAKLLYQKLLNDYPDSNQASAWQKNMEDLNIRLLFSPLITENSLQYEIRPGDTLTNIAKEHSTTVELIMKSNNISSDKISPGRKIKIWARPFSVVVDKSQNTLLLKSNEEVIKTYIVSTGSNNSTPTGTFKIVNKLTNPTWFKAGAVVPAGTPENILGSRWLGINVAGYGIHGTTQPQDLGRQVTQGCVRMANADVEELYIILPVGAEVTIVD